MKEGNFYMAKLPKEISQYIESTSEYNNDNLESFSEAVIEGISEEEKHVIEFVREELKQIQRYPYNWFKELALDKLILTMYRTYGYDYDTIDEKLVYDLLDYLEDPNTLEEIETKGRHL